jgi:hypothetical protein
LPWKYEFDRRIGSGTDHVAPPSVVRERIGSPRNANECWSTTGLLTPSAGCVNRSHVAYAYPARVGSPVTDTLSLEMPRLPSSSIRICGGRHVDPAVDVTEIAEIPSAAESIGWAQDPAR